MTTKKKPRKHNEILSEIRDELEATRLAYHELLTSISDDDMEKPTDNPSWNVRQVLFHMSLAPRLLPEDVRIIRSNRRIPRPPAALFNRLNDLYTRFGARNLSRDDLAQKYDVANEATLRALAAVEEDEWKLGMEYPDWDPLLSGFVNLERLFHYPAVHFRSHAKQIRRSLGLEDNQEE